MDAIKVAEFNPRRWQTVIMATLAFWLSASLFMDCLMMPGLYATGMLTDAGFAATGYSLFWIFNRVELLCGAIALTGILLLATRMWSPEERWVMVAVAVLLMSIPMVLTYALAPEMSALGIQLDLFAPHATVPSTMNWMHGGYFGLEVLKLALGAWLLQFLYRQVTKPANS
ncbi:hypothetical protein ACQ4M4_10320 [Leptolyngbya sp. AN02str]|uniref:hypothetical protein n=1 Tax=Leptolyngbya sp. AN02str TaxID=3423363 RepID=UPI003D31AADF